MEQNAQTDEELIAAVRVVASGGAWFEPASHRGCSGTIAFVWGAAAAVLVEHLTVITPGPGRRKGWPARRGDPDLREVQL